MKRSSHKLRSLRAVALGLLILIAHECNARPEMNPNPPSWDKQAIDLEHDWPALLGADGKKLTGWRFPATTPGRPRAVLVCLHGIQTHGAWYAPLAAELCGRGITLYCPDRRGNGHDPERNGVARASERGWSDWVVDTKKVIHAARLERAPVFLLGTSWGAKLALAVVADGKEPVAGTLLVAPALKTTKENWVKSLVVGFLNHVKPQGSISLRLHGEDYLPKRACCEVPDERDDWLLKEMDRDKQTLLQRATPHFLTQATAMQESALATLEKTAGAKSVESIFAARDRIVKKKASFDEIEDAGAPPPLPDLENAGHGVQVQEPSILAEAVLKFINQKLTR